ncbi:hypothetical protein ACHQM5_011467 [Ranunculus cassubicifolius]
MDSKIPSTTERLYEDFEPIANWATEESKTIEIHLPDFRKEQIKVQLSDTGNLKVSGERPLEGNKWSRFHLSFHLPKDSNFNEINAKFINNVLQIVLPKKTSRNSVLAAHPSTDKEIPTSQKTDNGQITKAEKPEKKVGIGGYVMKMSKPRRVLVVNVAVAITILVAAGVYAVYSASSVNGEWKWNY